MPKIKGSRFERKLPVLGAFYGDEGGPSGAAGTPGTASTDAYKDCPFLDPGSKEFCTLDKNLCPFVGFNYRKCKKYINNLSAGRLFSPQAAETAHRNRPPRLEALFEAAKKGGSGNPDSDFNKLTQDEKLGVTAGAQVGDQEYGKGEQSARKSDIEDLAKQILDSGGFRVLSDSTPTSLKSDLKKIQDARATAVAYANKYLDAEAGPAVKEIYDIIHSEYSSRWNLKNITDPITRKERETQHTDAEFENIFHRETEGGEVLPAADSNEEPTVSPVEKPDAKPKGNVGGKKRVKATVRVKGHPSESKIFDSEAKARAWAKKRKAELLKKKTRKGPASPIGAHVRASVGKGAPAAASTPTTHAEIEKKISRPRHKSGQAQSTSSAMRGPQFAAWLKTQQATHSREVLASAFGAGDADKVSGNIALLTQKANTLDDENAVYEISKMRRWFEKKLNDFEGIERQKLIFDREFTTNLAKARAIDPDIEKKLKPWRDDPKKLGKMAKFMNKAVRNSYELEFKTQKFGNTSITQLIRKVSIPEITKADLDVIRANEQMGLAAIHRQHLYGRKYGKFNTMALAARDVLLPIVLWQIGAADMIPHIKKMMPSQMLDAAYFAFIEPPIPKAGRAYSSSAPQLARTHRTEISRKMFSGRQKKLMKGFEKDQIMPPDRAIMHTQWGPTTKQPWGKTRKQELLKRHQQMMRAPSGDSWRKGFLRR